MTLRAVLMILPRLMVITALCCGCSGNDEGQVDGGTAEVLDGPATDVVGAIEAFGNVCDNIGQQCQDQGDSVFTLWCIAVAGGTAGKGFCSPQCSSLGQECYGVPNGQMAGCFIEESHGDAGPGTKYCGFLCAVDGKTYTCPGALTCGKINSQGQAICLP